MMTASQLAKAAGVSVDWFYRNYNRILETIRHDYKALPDGTDRFYEHSITVVQNLAKGETV